MYSSHSTACTLVLFEKRAPQPFVEIPFPESFRIGNVYCMVVFDLDFENLEYGYRMEGPNNFQQGHWFDPSKVLLDPYAKVVSGRDVWGNQPNWDDIYQHRGRLSFDDFDWENDSPWMFPSKTWSFMKCMCGVSPKILPPE
ncbi:hypothetical protein NON20_12760 [Synechocystis sp. B12]|nr:hypothetical protein NON20_12760 [Synechocystis sp. B12]